MGRSLTNTMINTGVESEFEEAVYEVHTCVEIVCEGKVLTC